MTALSTPTILLLLTGSSLALLACSDDGQVIALDVDPQITISLPAGLSTSEIRDLQPIRPSVSLSNGDSVSMSRGAGDNWSGTVNVVAGQQYTATVLWLESYYNGQELPLARLEQQLAVDENGNVTILATSPYDTDLHSDDDGVNNLQERQDGTNPFDPDSHDDEVIGSTRDATVGSDGAEQRTVAAVDVIIPRIAAEDAPEIDGNGVILDSHGVLRGEWSAAIQSDDSGYPLLIGNPMIEIDPGETDGSGVRRWAGLHDGSWLYLLVLVEADGPRTPESGSRMHDGRLEIYIDTGNGDITRPDLGDRLLILESRTGSGIGLDESGGTRFEPDVHEVRIDIGSVGIDPDASFGLALHIENANDGAEHVSRWVWQRAMRMQTGVNGIVSAPSSMGIARLE